MTKKMDPEVKAEWVKRLRSGEYEQAKESLVDTRSGGGLAYCCLGVLCKQATEAGLAKIRFNSDLKVFEVYDEHEDFVTGENDGWLRTADEELPELVQKWAGVDTASPVVNGRCLTFWNDGRKYRGEILEGVDFATIADMIEAEL